MAAEDGFHFHGDDFGSTKDDVTLAVAPLFHIYGLSTLLNIAVRYGADGPVPDPTPRGCGYPSGSEVAVLEENGACYERVAAGKRDRAPIELACLRPDDARRVTAASNARTLRALVRRSSGRTRPHAAVSTFGFGEPRLPPRQPSSSERRDARGYCYRRYRFWAEPRDGLGSFNLRP